MPANSEWQIATKAIDAWRSFHDIIECVPSSNAFVKRFKLNGCDVRIEIRKSDSSVAEGADDGKEKRPR